MEKWETSLASLRAMVKFFKVCGTPSRGLNSFLAWNPHQAPVPPFHTLYVLMVRAPFFSPKPLQRLGVGGVYPSQEAWQLVCTCWGWGAQDWRCFLARQDD